MFGRSRAVVGLDIGSSAVKAVELKGSGKSFKVTAFGIEPVPPDSIVDGAIIDGAAVANAIRRLFESKNIRTKDVAASLSGHSVIVKKISFRHDRGGARGVDPLGGRAVHPLRHRRRQPRFSDHRGQLRPRRARWTSSSSRPRRTRSTTTPTFSSRPACTPVVVDLDAFALQNACEINYEVVPGARGACQHRRGLHQHRRPAQRHDLVHPRHLDRRQPLHRRRAEEFGLPARAGRADQDGPGRRRRPRGRCRAVLRRHRERPARNREDVRLLQGDRIAIASTASSLCGGASRVDGFVELLANRFDTRSSHSIRSTR